MRTFAKARNALCAGDLDFVFSVDGTGAVRFSYPPGVSTDTLYTHNFPDGEYPTITSERPTNSNRTHLCAFALSSAEVGRKQR